MRLATNCCILPALLVLAALLVAAASARPTEPLSMSDLRVMTFNIRNSGAKDGPNHWTHRKALAMDVVRAFDPDLLGLQEVLHDQAEDVRAGLPAYVFVGVGRNDGREAGEYSPVLYRAARFDLLQSGTFWLSDTPETVASKGWDAALPRIATWALLRDKASGARVLFLNTHWDHIGQRARVESAKLIRRKVAELLGGDGEAPKTRVVIVGDFNALEEHDAMRTLIDATAPPRLIDAYRTLHPERRPDEASYHDFNGRREGGRIDFILHTPELTATEAAIDRTARDGRYPSDHYPVTAVLGRAPQTR